MSDQFKTIEGCHIGEYRDKGSKFVAYAYPCHSLEEMKEQLTAIKKEHPKARHHCFAYRLDNKKQLFRANDDGEPSGTAGKPILGQIDSFGLSMVNIIVVRYFGGTKLGVPGLINAYRSATKDALSNAKIIEKRLMVEIRLQFSYIYINDVMRVLKKDSIKIVNQTFEEEYIIDFRIPKDDQDNIIVQLNKLRHIKIITNQ